MNEAPRYDVRRRKGSYGWSAPGPGRLTIRNMTRVEAEAEVEALANTLAFDWLTGKYVLITTAYLQPTTTVSETGSVVVEGTFTDPSPLGASPAINLWLDSAI